MKVLAIETSCDETAVCLVKFKNSKDSESPVFEVIANKLISQIDIHKEFGGVYPDLAKREHIKNLPILLSKVVGDEENFKTIDALAVTVGPGLSPALWTGIEITKNISKEYNIPIYPINHMEGHIFASTLLDLGENKFKIQNINLPAIALLISGGHTELILIGPNYNYTKIGETQDDAVGEAFDKTARALGYEYPGGPEISKRAELARLRSEAIREELRLPRPMYHSKDLNFSFSGLKTSVINKIEKYNIISNEEKELFCMEFENAVTDVLVKKTREALYLYNAKSLVVGGGVSANNHIRESLTNICEEDGIDIYLGEKKNSTDNALMIAATAVVKILNNTKPMTEIDKLKANPNLDL
jgi:N6-L-threonylcarbamoyladenine synthase